MWPFTKKKKKVKKAKKQKRRYPRQDGEHNFDWSHKKVSTFNLREP